MTPEKKLALGKNLIFISSLVAVSAALYFNLVAPSFPELPQHDPFSIWETVLGLTVSLIFIYGLFLGSRGVGSTLNISTFFKLLFGFPCWIPFAIYFIVTFVFLIIES